MVGIVVISHSRKLANGVVDVTKIMADGCPIVGVGGTETGYGTDYEAIKAALSSVHGDDGVIVLADMGSAVMTAEMAIEDLGYTDVQLVDCPLAEGAIAASLASVCGEDLAAVKEKALATRQEAKW